MEFPPEPNDLPKISIVRFLGTMLTQRPSLTVISNSYEALPPTFRLPLTAFKRRATL